jgi:hypothetical protein
MKLLAVIPHLNVSFTFAFLYFSLSVHFLRQTHIAGLIGLSLKQCPLACPSALQQTHLPYNSTLPTTPITTSTAGFSISIDSPPTNKWRRQFSLTLLRVSLRVRDLLLANRLDCSGVTKMSLKNSRTRFPPSKLCFWMRRRSRPTTIWSKIGLGSSRMPCTKPTTCWMITPPNFYGDK